MVAVSVTDEVMALSIDVTLPVAPFHWGRLSLLEKKVPEIVLRVKRGRYWS
jgi:hypothetical protein